ncbi:MAG TPA: DEAD/DEAH box helicase, partial [Mariprofundaceae bacterium]|nr:DEAD/DEAH box helicase [Mariprofundaceae bacterium]
MYSFLTKPLNLLPGVGSAMEKRFHGRGLFAFGDLLLHLPKRYVDDRQITPIKELQEGVEARIEARIIQKSARGFGRKRQVTLTLADEDDARITLNFFHSGYMMTDARLSEGREISVRGVSERWSGRLQMSHPEWVVSDAFVPGWHPIYPSLAGLSGRRIETLIGHALSMMPASATSPLDSQLADSLSLRKALIQIHQPDGEEANVQLTGPAFERLKQEELLIYLQLMQEKRSEAEVPARLFDDETLEKKLIESLPFPLTEAQQHVWQEISADLSSGKRMHRLLQGDVGAGKTWVAALAIARATASHKQAAMMAPTEVLAAQHYQTLKALLEPLNIDVALLTGSTKAKERKDLLKRLADGSLACVVGTHALISADVEYAALG